MNNTPTQEVLTVENKCTKGTFEPTIIGFTCLLCSNHSANISGIKHLKNPAQVRLIRMLCSGRLEPKHVLKAFASGADGVIISGCHPGNSHYAEQKTKSDRRFSLMQHILLQMGIEPERLKLIWDTPESGPRLTAEIDRMVEDVYQMGPLKRPASQQIKNVLDETSILQT